MTEEELKKQEFTDCIYAIKDVKVGKFGNPFVASNDSEAIRIFNDLVLGSTDSLLAKHPEDYDLYAIGLYNVVLGLICPDDSVTFLLNAQTVFENVNRKIKSFNFTPENENSVDVADK